VSIKVSVIVPVFNASNYIERCIYSLFDNTIADECEFIIVDDCSTDSSVLLIERIISERKDKNIKLIKHHYNKGAAAARNTALNIAKGEYVIFVDSDDWVEKNYLELLYDNAMQNDSDITMCGLYKESETDSKIISFEIKENSDYVNDLLTEALPGWLWIKLFRLEFLKRNNIHFIDNINICEDLIFCLKAFSATKNISYVDKSLYHYNIMNQNSLTSTMTTDKVQQLISAVEIIEKLLDGKYQSSLLNLKSRIKIWILKKIDDITPYITLYNECKLSHCANSSLLNRLFFLLCEKKMLVLIKLIIRYKDR